MFRRILLDRRVWLVAAGLILVAILARVVVSPETGFSWVIHGGYWFVLGSLVFFLGALVPLVRARWARWKFERFDAGVLLAIVACVSVWTTQDRPGFKILADEVLLLGTSMSLHYDRAAAYPVRATDTQGPFLILDYALDKRPLLFPFLTATVHDLTGYRPENAFYLNMGLAGLFLGVVYLLAVNAGRGRWPGLFVLLLFAGLPLLAQQATGGGFELLNLLLIATLGLLMMWYLEEPDGRRLQAMVYGGVLLASTRYESILFLIPMALAAVWGWWRSGRVMLSWPTILSPLFLLPVLLQNQVFSTNKGSWELAGVAGATRPFGPEYFADNLGHALAFFFDLGPYQPSSPLFAALGLLALPIFALWAVRVFRAPGDHGPRQTAAALLGVGLGAVTLVHLFYFWGRFDDPVIHRLSLPLHLLLALALVVVGARLAFSDRVWKALALVALGGLLFHGLPVMAKQAYAHAYSPGVEMELRREFISLLPERDYLFIDNDSVFWITQKIPATPAGQAGARKDGLSYHLRNHSFSQMYVFQSILIDDQTGARRVDPVDDLGPDFELETVLERRVGTLLFARISRVVAIRHEGREVARSTTAVPVKVERRSPEEIEKARAIYMENWIKQLP